MAGKEPEYKQMKVFCLIATIPDDPSCPVASEVRKMGRGFGNKGLGFRVWGLGTMHEFGRIWRHVGLYW